MPYHHCLATASSPGNSFTASQKHLPATCWTGTVSNPKCRPQAGARIAPSLYFFARTWNFVGPPSPRSYRVRNLRAARLSQRDRAERTTGPLSEGPSLAILRPGFTFSPNPREQTKWTTGPLSEGPSLAILRPGFTFSPNPREQTKRTTGPLSEGPSLAIFGRRVNSQHPKAENQKRTTGPLRVAPSLYFFCLDLELRWTSEPSVLSRS